MTIIIEILNIFKPTLFKSFLYAALAIKNIIPYTASSALKKNEGLGLADVKAFCVNAADNPDKHEAIVTHIIPRLLT